MNGSLGRSEVWDLACFHEVKIIKRAVYVRCAPQYDESTGKWKDRAIKRNLKKPFRFVGHLAKGVSTKQARVEITDSYGK